MRVARIIWLPDVEEKRLDKHNVLAEEVEEVLYAEPHIRFVERGYQAGQDLYAAYGQTDEDRYLIVFFILKEGKTALIISARDMDQKERKLYGRHRG